jgi:hypothetical protein
MRRRASDSDRLEVMLWGAPVLQCKHYCTKHVHVQKRFILFCYGYLLPRVEGHFFSSISLKAPTPAAFETFATSLVLRGR